MIIDFTEAADYYINHVGKVEPGVDLSNKKFILSQLYKLSGGTSRGLLEATKKSLERGVKIE